MYSFYRSCLRLEFVNLRGCYLVHGKYSTNRHCLSTSLFILFKRSPFRWEISCDVRLVLWKKVMWSFRRKEPKKVEAGSNVNESLMIFMIGCWTGAWDWWLCMYHRPHPPWSVKHSPFPHLCDRHRWSPVPWRHLQFWPLIELHHIISFSRIINLEVLNFYRYNEGKERT